MATSATATTRKRLALAMIDFLNSSLTDGTLSPADDTESVEVATSCIADLFKVDPSDSGAIGDALGSGQNLLSIYTVYEKLKGKSTPSTEGPSSATEGRPSTPSTPGGASAAKNPEAEALKGQGNVAMQKKDYATAIDFYTKAIEISPTNPIYLSNRAAAYSGKGDHEQARQDAEMAVAADPKYTKAWSRLGLARFALGDPKGSMEAYKSGIDAEGSGGSEAMRKGYETAKKKVDEMADEDDVASPRSPGAAGAGTGGMPDLASMFGGGGGGGGGMPDLSAMLQNPMMQQMAQNLMSNPDMMNNLMNNPRLRDLANQYGSGGGMPDFGSLMNDPSLAEMARNFMGGGGGGAGRGGPPPGSS